MATTGRPSVGRKRDVRASDALWRALGEAAAIEAAERKAADRHAGAVDRCVILRELAAGFIASKGIEMPVGQAALFADPPPPTEPRHPAARVLDQARARQAASAVRPA